MGTRDLTGSDRYRYQQNRKIVLARDEVCGLCHRYVDKTYGGSPTNPWGPVVDHIIPKARGGHPYDLRNLHMAHFKCNEMKSDSILTKKQLDVIQASYIQAHSDLGEVRDYALEVDG